MTRPPPRAAGQPAKSTAEATDSRESNPGAPRAGESPMSGFDAAIASSTLDDPALAKVKAFALATDWVNAAKTLEAIMAKLKGLTA